jgi:hypothetical protein
MTEEIISADDEREYVLDLVSDLGLSPNDSIQSLLDALEEESEADSEDD